MLRPAVAATNCAKAGKTTGSDMGDGAPVNGREPEGPKVPGREEAVNDGPKTALSQGPGTRPSRRGSGRGKRGDPSVLRNIRGDLQSRRLRQSLTGIGRNPPQNVAFSPYIKSSRGQYDDWCAFEHCPRDWSHRKTWIAS